MALVIVRAILANPEKFSLGLGQAAVKFDRFWFNQNDLAGGSSGQEYWSQPENVERFPQHSETWKEVQELLPEDLSERLNARKD